MLAFQAGSKLKRVEVASGEMQIICDLSGLISGGAWGADGTILFAMTGGSNETRIAGRAPRAINRSASGVQS